jgi:hypothetical protein
MTAHSPFACAFAGMARLPGATNKVVLLDSGSYPAFSNYVNATWTWNGTDWTAVTTAANGIDSAGPLPSRQNFAMTYDGTNIMMYGGQAGSETGGSLNDTWTWNGTVWAKATGTAPFARTYAEACQFNTGATSAIMFGGFGGGGGGTFLNETWSWNGASKQWSQITTAASPPARIGHCMDGGPSYTIMFGGQGTNSLLNDTWKYDGTNWTQLNPATVPSVRTGAQMCYDQTRNVWVMFGGQNTAGRLAETWIFDGTNWTLCGPQNSPAGVTWGQMCWDGHTNRVMMFGGFNSGDSSISTGAVTSQTWAWSGTTWSQL